MTKEIMIGGKQNIFTANGATPIFYKQFFHKDLIKMMAQNEDTIEVATENIPEIAFIMAMQGAGKDMSKLTQEMYIDWLSSFDALDLTLKGAEIIAVYIGDTLPTEEPKKKENVKRKG